MTPVRENEPAHPHASPGSPFDHPEPPRKGGWVKWLWAIVFAGAVVGGVTAWKNHQAAVEMAAASEGGGHPGGGRHGGGKGGGGGGNRGPVPVVIGEAEKHDVPIFLNGLGIVQAYNNVTVRARVEGELQAIYFTEGQNVKKGDLIAQIDPRTYQAALDQAKAKKMQDAAQLANAKSTLARNDLLIKNGVIDQQTYDNQKYTADQLAAAVAADQAAVDSAQTELDYTHIAAPIDGRVGIRQVDVGNIIRTSDTNSIVVINQIQPISVVFTLPQQDLNRAREALMSQKQLEVLALDRDNESTLSKGTLEVLDNQIDATTATVKLKAVFANEDYKLWPGQFVNVRLLLGTQKDAITVPAPAVQRGPDGTYVYTVAQDNKAEMRNVTVGPTEDNQTVITKGLAAGEQIVIDGQYRLQEGSRIQPTEATDEEKKNPPKPAADSTNQ